MAQKYPRKSTTRASQARSARDSVDVRPYSRLVVDGVKQAPARAMLHAVGDAGALETPPANWGNNPITGQFIDLPAAVTTARAHGMVGAFNHAMLQGTASGPVCERCTWRRFLREMAREPDYL